MIYLVAKEKASGKKPLDPDATIKSLIRRPVMSNQTNSIFQKQNKQLFSLCSGAPL